MIELPRSGDLVRLGRAASVQFIGRPLIFRVIRVHDWNTYDGWVWLEGYELNISGEAVDRRSVFVQVKGIQRTQVTPLYPRQTTRRTTDRAKPADVKHHRRGNGPRENDDPA